MVGGQNCPRCGKWVYPVVSSRENSGTIDLVFRCPECQSEWSFDILKGLRMEMIGKQA